MLTLIVLVGVVFWVWVVLIQEEEALWTQGECNKTNTSEDRPGRE